MFESPSHLASTFFIECVSILYVSIDFNFKLRGYIFYYEITKGIFCFVNFDLNLIGVFIICVYEKKTFSPVRFL